MSEARSIGGLIIRRLVGDDLKDHIAALAELRVTVFRDFPYLYDGHVDYESRYLQTYLDSRDSVLVAAFDGNRIVGASTGLPLRDETANIIDPFIRFGYAIESVFYFGESVLLRPYRGRGVGVAFFEEREGWARTLGHFEYTSFCGVIRPDTHPRRPADHVPLDEFWRRRGYESVPGMEATFRWRDLDEAEQSEKRMRFWIRHLNDGA